MCRSATPAGNSSAWSMVFNLMVGCRPTRRSVVEMTRSIRCWPECLNVLPLSNTDPEMSRANILTDGACGAPQLKHHPAQLFYFIRELCHCFTLSCCRFFIHTWPHATNIASWVLERFFSETGAGKHVPRCVMVDLEPTEACICLVAFLLLNRAL